MITPEQIAEAAPLYEEWRNTLNPIEARQAKLILDKICREVYEAEPEELRAKMKLDFYVAAILAPEFNRYLSQRASKFPTIQPERRHVAR